MTDYVHEVQETASFTDTLGGFGFGKTLEENEVMDDTVTKHAAIVPIESAGTADTITKDARKLVTGSVSSVEFLAKKSGKTFTQNQAYVDTATEVNVLYTTKFITGNPNNIEALVEDYLATIGTDLSIIKGVACVPISADNFGVLIIHA